MGGSDVALSPPTPTKSIAAFEKRFTPPPKPKQYATCKEFGLHDNHCVRCPCSTSCTHRVLLGTVAARSGLPQSTCRLCGVGAFNCLFDFLKHLFSGKCTRARGGTPKRSKNRARAEELTVAAANIVSRDGKEYWECGRCDFEGGLGRRWAHIFTTASGAKTSMRSLVTPLCQVTRLMRSLQCFEIASGESFSGEFAMCLCCMFYRAGACTGMG